MSSPLILETKLDNTKIIMYGEEHSNIDNSHYERVSKSFKAKDMILVEHSTTVCEIKPEEEYLFRGHAKGSEWIFYTQKMASNPNVICFDTRAEEGYLNAFQEQRLMNLGDKLPSCTQVEVKEYIDGVIHSIKTFSTNSKKFEAFMPGYFEDSMEILESQLKVVMHLLVLKKKKGDKSPEMLSKILSGAGYTLGKNLRRVASVSVDIDLVSMLNNLGKNSTKGSNIYVFGGRNHVVRMALMLGLSVGDLPREYIESAKLELDGDLALDAKLLQTN